MVMRVRLTLILVVAAGFRGVLVGLKKPRVEAAPLAHLARHVQQRRCACPVPPRRLRSATSKGRREAVWGPTYLNETHDLRQYMAQLRKKLEPDATRPRQPLTEPVMGYRFMP